jgi:hypothetical protein
MRVLCGYTKGSGRRQELSITHNIFQLPFQLLFEPPFEPPLKTNQLLTMHYQTLLTLLVPAFLAAGVHAECYKSGRKWDNTAPANDVIQAICNGNDGGVSGTFAYQQSKDNCHQQDGGLKYIFHIQYVGAASSITLDDAACRQGLRNEVNACSQGGESTSGDWFFK